MPSVGFEPTISTGERAQTYALDRAATGAGIASLNNSNYTKQKAANYYDVLPKDRDCYRQCTGDVQLAVLKLLRE
jgi:hypothetical protein